MFFSQSMNTIKSFLWCKPFKKASSCLPLWLSPSWPDFQPLHISFYPLDPHLFPPNSQHNCFPYWSLHPSYVPTTQWKCQNYSSCFSPFVTIHLLLSLPMFGPFSRTSPTSFMKPYVVTQDHSVLSFLWTSTSPSYSTPELCCMLAPLALSFTEMPIDQWPQKSVTLSDLSFFWWCHGLVWRKRVTWLWKELTSSLLAVPRMVNFIKWF